MPNEKLEDVLSSLATELVERTHIPGSFDFVPEECFVVRVVSVAVNELRGQRQQIEALRAKVEQLRTDGNRLKSAACALLDQPTMPGASVPDQYRQAWKALYTVLEDDDG